MVTKLDSTDNLFKHDLKRLLEKDLLASEVTGTVSEIIRNIVKSGDSVLLAYTKKFDGADFADNELRVTETEIDEAYGACREEVISALELAAKRIETYHYQQVPDDKIFKDNSGIRLGWKWTPIEAVGVYVPGGLASYPSTVLMNAIPARIAGVSRIVMTVPTRNGELNPIVLAAAKIAGIEEIYKIGGAQAIAALAYGTETIPPVDKIVGPGNAYVAEAKRQVFGKVGIDMIAGPSEIVVISDKHSNPDWIAADLLSQAEHDSDARSILITDDEKFANAVESAVEETLETLDRRKIARESWSNNGIIIIVPDLEEAVNIANIIAPEHLELAVNNPEKLEKKIKNAGAIFFGRFTPEAIGDYIAGPSHVLPTSGSARFSSGLSVYDFLKRSSVISCDKPAFQNIAEATELLALEEGLSAHALSVTLRMGKKG